MQFKFSEKVAHLQASQIREILKYSVFWFMGIYMAKHYSKITLILSVCFILLGISMLVFFTCVYENPNNIVSEIIRKLGSILILYGLFSTSLSKISEKISRYKMVKSIDRNSMGIYILHHIFIWWIVQIPNVTELLDSHIVIMPIILFGGALISSWYFSELLRHINCLKWTLGEKVKSNAN